MRFVEMRFFVIPNYKTTSLIESIKNNNIEKFEECLKKIAMDQKNHEKLVLSNNLDSNGACAMYWAVTMADLSMFQMMHKFKVDFNTLLCIPNTSERQTPLMQLISLNRTDIVTFLIEQGIPLNIQNSSSISPFVQAVFEDNDECIQILLNEIRWRSFAIYFDRKEHENCTPQENIKHQMNESEFTQVVFDIAGINKEWLEYDQQCNCIHMLRNLLINHRLDKKYIKALNLLKTEVIKPLISNKFYSCFSQLSFKNQPVEITQLIMEYSATTISPLYHHTISKNHKQNLKRFTNLDINDTKTKLLL